ncbi:MAG TPA: hypothetical protein GXX36_14655 [Clostridiaceae bacterium]|nr:hypothetical protein [Clostridiaceae bacterium]
MKDFLSKDTTIKIFSVVIAILLWLYALNTSDPFDTRKFYVSLRIQNEDTLEEKGLVLKNKDYRKNIEVLVRGRTEALRNLTSDDFTAILDFSKVESEKDTKIRIEGPYYNTNEITILDVNPKVIEVELEKLKKKSFPVDVQVEGELQAGFKLVGLSYAPEFVEIDNMESVIDTVASIKTTVNISNYTGTVDINKECKVYNKDGKEIPSLGKNISVNIRIEIAKEVPIRLEVKGSPAKEHFEEKRSITPSKALIKGSPEVLAKITELKTEPVDISNATESINVTSPLVLPQGVTLVDTPQDIKVNISIENNEIREFSFTRDEIALTNTLEDNSLEYQIKNDTVTVRVKGRQSLLNSLRKSDIKLRVNVAGYKEGIHRVPLDVSLPSGFSRVDEQFVEVNIKKVFNEEAETE